MKLQPRWSQSSPWFCCTAKSFLALFLACCCVLFLIPDLPGLLSSSAQAKEKKQKLDPVLKGLPIADLTVDEAILHVLNRLAYGPQPGDVDRIKNMGEKGLARWIEQQLNPNGIDDAAMQVRLENYPTLKMSMPQLIAQYPQPKAALKLVALKQPDKQDMGEPKSQTVVPSLSDVNAPSSMKAGNVNRNQPTSGKRDGLGSADPNSVPRGIADDNKKPQRVVEELAMAKITRAIYSQRQLQQVMDDFWFNHFNVFAGKGEDKWYLTSYEQDVIAPHALGKFKDLVTDTAKSPAMLFYLDNFLSADPNAAQRLAAMRQQRGRYPRRFPKPQQAKNSSRGLNENYGRELMELHTLGVDGGYTQKDVTEVARCFTGWTIEKPRENPVFKFDEKIHDPEPKVVLGKKISTGGIKDGEQVIELLARHPSTAKFISLKMARRFVSDTPPPELVARMAKTFRETDGDIRSVMRTMIYSPEFWSRESYRAKVKTPLELVVSSVRALGTDVDTPMPLVQWINRIGEPLYQCQPPTGYADKAESWVNTGALLNRLNFSLALAGNRIRGSRTDVSALLGFPGSIADAQAALERGVQVFLYGQATPSTVETLRKQLQNSGVVQAELDDPVKQVDLGTITGLVLGAPEFQRR